MIEFNPSVRKQSQSSTKKMWNAPDQMTKQLMKYNNEILYWRMFERGFIEYQLVNERYGLVTGYLRSGLVFAGHVL